MKKLLIIGLVCMVCSVTANADVIAGYTFASNLDATSSHAEVTASATGGLGARSGSAGGCNFTRANLTTYPPSLAAAIAGAEYVNFTVDVAAGKALNMTSLTLQQGYSQNAGAGYVGKFVAVDLLTSATGFTADDSVFYNKNVADTASSTTIYYDSLDIDLSGAAFQGLTGLVEIRLYLTDDTGSPDVIHRLDDIVLNGTIVPEPATLCLLGLGSLVALKRKK